MRRRVSSILVVADEGTVATTMVSVLVRAGFEVERTRQGADAVARLSAPDSAPPDLVVLSIADPMERGIGVLRLLRETLHGRQPVVVLTTGATPEQAEEMHRLGVSTLLFETASPETVLAAVRDALRRR